MGETVPGVLRCVALPAWARAHLFLVFHPRLCRPNVLALTEENQLLNLALCFAGGGGGVVCLFFAKWK